MDGRIALFTTIVALLLIGRIIAFYIIDNKEGIKSRWIEVSSSVKRGFKILFKMDED